MTQEPSRRWLPSRRKWGAPVWWRTDNRRTATTVAAAAAAVLAAKLLAAKRRQAARGAEDIGRWEDDGGQQE